MQLKAESQQQLEPIQEQQELINVQSSEIETLKKALFKQKEIVGQLKSDNGKLESKTDDMSDRIQKIEQMLNLTTATKK